MRRLLPLLLLLTTVLGAAPTAAAGPPPPTLIDRMSIGHLPAGLGPSTEFRYEYDEVAFVSRDWESSRPGGGYRIDLTVEVLRGARLTDPRELHDWLIAYEDRPAGEAHYVPTTVRGRPGWIGADELFWLWRPGVAMVVRLDTTRWPHHELRRTARSVHEVGSLLPG